MAQPAVHTGVTCDLCHTCPIRGARHKCINCVDFDLCEKCERAPAVREHVTKHAFLALRTPADPQWHALWPALLPSTLVTNVDFTKPPTLTADEVVRQLQAVSARPDMYQQLYAMRQTQQAKWVPPPPPGPVRSAPPTAGGWAFGATATQPALPRLGAARLVVAGAGPDAAAIPLLGVALEVTITDWAARVTVTQNYRNQESADVECTYRFPVPPGAALVGFEAEIGGRLMRGVAEEKERARDVYDDALAGGQRAALLEHLAEDLFEVTLGRFPAGAWATARITLVTELLNEPGNPDAARFAFPLSVFPRCRSPHTEHTSPGDDPMEHAPQETPYTTDVDVRVQLSAAIHAITSPSHAVRVSPTGPGSATVRVAPKGAAIVPSALVGAALDADLVLVVAVAPGTRQPLAEAVIECDPAAPPQQRYALAVAVVPRFPPDVEAQPNSELVFVVDCSGSMGGAPIAQAQRLLQLALASLPTSTTFNVIRFGDRHDTLFPAAARLDDANLARARQWVGGKLRADLGGTELLPPLREALAAPVPAGRARQIFVLTDGGVSQPDAVLQLVAQARGTTRVFAFGIGDACSRYLVSGLAERGGGTAAYVRSSDQDLSARVIAVLDEALSPALTGAALDFPGAPAVRPACAEVPPIFANRRHIFYAFADESFRPPARARLRFTLPHAQQPQELGADLTGAAVVEGRTVHQLAARARCKELEAQAAPPRAEIVALCTAFGLASTCTSFVCVDSDTAAAPAAGPLKQTRVPTRFVSLLEAAKAKEGSSGGGFSFGGSFGGFGAAGVPQAAHSFGGGGFGIPRGAAPSFGGGFGLGIQPPAPAAAAHFGGGVPQMAAPCFSFAQAAPAGFGAAPTAAVPQTPLDRIAAAQAADGGWELTAELFAALPLTLPRERVLAGVPDPQRAREWATAVVLAVLRLAFADKQGEWLLLARKAERLLAGCGCGHFVDSAVAALQFAVRNN